MGAERKQCPCCGQDKPLGLFDLRPQINLPLPVEVAAQSGADERDVLRHRDVVGFADRWFLNCEASLPLGRLDSPIKVGLWIELSPQQLQAVQAVRRGERRQASGRAHLACELPGFAGSIGALCRYRIRAGDELAQIVDISDRRLALIPEDAGHETMAALYRRLFGNTEPLADAQALRRALAEASLRQQVGRAVYDSEITPPPQLAGVEPAKLLVSPPLDTGEAAFMATVGCADWAPDGHEPVEIAAWLRNPSNQLIECFSEFAYLSRMNSRPITSNYVVRERRPIPGTDDSFVAWMLVDPWWLSADEGVVRLDGGVRLLAAVPLYPSEVEYAKVFGTEDLASELMMTSEDLTDLNRESVAALPR